MHLATSQIKAARNVIAIGNTYPVRSELAALGGRFSTVEQGWVIPVPSGSGACAKLSQETFRLARLGVKFRAEN